SGRSDPLRRRSSRSALFLLARELELLPAAVRHHWEAEVLAVDKLLVRSRRLAMPRCSESAFVSSRAFPTSSAHPLPRLWLGRYGPPARRVNESVVPARASIAERTLPELGAAVDHQHLASHEVAIVAGEEGESAFQVGGHLVASDGARAAAA